MMMISSFLSPQYLLLLLPLLGPEAGPDDGRVADAAGQLVGYATGAGGDAEQSRGVEGDGAARALRQELVGAPGGRPPPAAARAPGPARAPPTAAA